MGIASSHTIQNTTIRRRHISYINGAHKKPVKSVLDLAQKPREKILNMSASIAHGANLLEMSRYRQVKEYVNRARESTNTDSPRVILEVMTYDDRPFKDDSNHEIPTPVMGVMCQATETLNIHRFDHSRLHHANSDQESSRLREKSAPKEAVAREENIEHGKFLVEVSSEAKFASDSTALQLHHKDNSLSDNDSPSTYQIDVASTSNGNTNMPTIPSNNTINVNSSLQPTLAKVAERACIVTIPGNKLNTLEPSLPQKLPCTYTTLSGHGHSEGDIPSDSHQTIENSGNRRPYSVRARVGGLSSCEISTKLLSMILPTSMRKAAKLSWRNLRFARHVVKVIERLNKDTDQGLSRDPSGSFYNGSFDSIFNETGAHQIQRSKSTDPDMWVRSQTRQRCAIDRSSSATAGPTDSLLCDNNYVSKNDEKSSILSHDKFFQSTAYISESATEPRRQKGSRAHSYVASQYTNLKLPAPALSLREQIDRDHNKRYMQMTISNTPIRADRIGHMNGKFRPKSSQDGIALAARFAEHKGFHYSCENSESSESILIDEDEMTNMSPHLMGGWSKKAIDTLDCSQNIQLQTHENPSDNFAKSIALYHQQKGNHNGVLMVPYLSTRNIQRFIQMYKEGMFVEGQVHTRRAKSLHKNTFVTQESGPRAFLAPDEFEKNMRFVKHMTCRLHALTTILDANSVPLPRAIYPLRLQKDSSIREPCGKNVSSTRLSTFITPRRGPKLSNATSTEPRCGSKYEGKLCSYLPANHNSSSWDHSGRIDTALRMDTRRFISNESQVTHAGWAHTPVNPRLRRYFPKREHDDSGASRGSIVPRESSIAEKHCTSRYKHSFPGDTQSKKTILPVQTE